MPRRPTPQSWAIGPLTPGKPGRHYVNPPMDFATPLRVCNAASTKALNLAAEWRHAAIRPGSLAFLQVPQPRAGLRAHAACSTATLALWRKRTCPSRPEMSQAV